MFEDEILDAARQAVLACKRHPIGDVRDDRRRRNCRIQIIVRVHLSLRLVFDEEHRIHGFTHIVEHRADARQQGIGADQFRSLLGEIRHLQAVLVRTGCIS